MPSICGNKLQWWIIMKTVRNAKSWICPEKTLSVYKQELLVLSLITWSGEKLWRSVLRDCQYQVSVFSWIKTGAQHFKVKGGNNSSVEPPVHKTLAVCPMTSPSSGRLATGPLLLEFSCIIMFALMSWLPGQPYDQETMTCSYCDECISPFYTNKERRW